MCVSICVGYFCSVVVSYVKFYSNVFASLHTGAGACGAGFILFLGPLLFYMI